MPARLASSAIFMAAPYTFDRLEGQDSAKGIDIQAA
jgi:hypothetical protein